MPMATKDRGTPRFRYHPHYRTGVILQNRLQVRHPEELRGTLQNRDLLQERRLTHSRSLPAGFAGRLQRMAALAEAGEAQDIRTRFKRVYSVRAEAGKVLGSPRVWKWT